MSEGTGWVTTCGDLWEGQQCDAEVAVDSGEGNWARAGRVVEQRRWCQFCLIGRGDVVAVEREALKVGAV